MVHEIPGKSCQCKSYHKGNTGRLENTPHPVGAIDSLRSTYKTSRKYELKGCL